MILRAVLAGSLIFVSDRSQQMHEIKLRSEKYFLLQNSHQDQGKTYGEPGDMQHNAGVKVIIFFKLKILTGNQDFFVKKMK